MLRETEREKEDNFNLKSLENNKISVRKFKVKKKV